MVSDPTDIGDAMRLSAVHPSPHDRDTAALSAAVAECGLIS